MIDQKLIFLKESKLILRHLSSREGQGVPPKYRYFTSNSLPLKVPLEAITHENRNELVLFAEGNVNM